MGPSLIVLYHARSGRTSDMYSPHACAHAGVHRGATPPANPSPNRRLRTSPSWSQAPSAAAMALKKLGVALKASLEKLFGPTLHLSASTIELTFPTAFERLHTSFFRTKITSWMAAQEEDYRCALPFVSSSGYTGCRGCVALYWAGLACVSCVMLLLRAAGRRGDVAAHKTWVFVRASMKADAMLSRFGTAVCSLISEVPVEIGFTRSQAVSSKAMPIPTSSPHARPIHDHALTDASVHAVQIHHHGSGCYPDTLVQDLHLPR